MSYTPPSHDSIQFEMGETYTPPGYSSIHFVMEDEVITDWPHYVYGIAPDAVLTVSLAAIDSVLRVT